MDTSAFWIIVLALWIWVLQNRIKELEKRVQSLLSRQDAQASLAPQETSAIEVHRELPKPETSVTERKSETDRVQEESAVAAFKDAHAQEAFKEPSLLFGWLTRYFGGGNLLVRIGGVILFFGLAFLVKYAAAHIEVSIGVRLVLIALFGMALCIIGWRLRQREGAYGQILQGVGVAVLYLVVYAAAKFYMLLSLNLSFALMFGIVVFGSILAIMQKSQPLALFSTAGGFLAPILASSGAGSHVILFGYYLLLNFGILLMAWQYSWRVLNLTGFLFTFVIATAWGVLQYQSALFETTEPFLLLYFVMYIVITVLFAQKGKRDRIDTMLLFGLPAVVFPLQTALVSHITDGAGWSAVGFGLFYLVLGVFLKKRVENRLLTESFYGIGILFLTLSIPYFFEANITAALWAMEASAAICLSLKQSHVWGRYAAEVLLVIAMLLYLQSAAHQPLSLSLYLGYLLITIALFVSGALLHVHRKSLQKDHQVPELFLLLSFLVWMGSVYRVAEVWTHVRTMHIMTLGVTAGSILFYLAQMRVKWKILVEALQVTLPLGALFFLASLSDADYFDPFIGIGTWVFVSLFLWQGYLLYRFAETWHLAGKLHVLSLWFGTGVLSLALYSYAMMHLGGGVVAWMLVASVPLLMSWLLLQRVGFAGRLAPYKESYQKTGVGGLLVFLFLWEIALLRFSLTETGVPYLPLLNPLDLMQAAVLWLLFLWSLHFLREHFWQKLLAFFALILLSTIFARAVHYYADVPYTIPALWHSLYFQTGVSILWSLTAFVLMYLSKRYGSRLFWMSGFALLGLVVVKLFFVEMAQSGTVERIVSFLAVGVLLLLIGYFVPLPPNAEDDE